MLEIELPSPKLPSDWRSRPVSAWKYKEFLPLRAGTAPVSLGEGGTPLVSCDRLAAWCGVRHLYVKVEGANPTGSFKDRGMTCAVSWAVSGGAKVLGCASTGNTAASMAAYAARAGVRAVVLVPQGKIAAGKLAQSVGLGATVLEVDGNFDEAMRIVLGLAKDGRVALLNSRNPFRLEGQKTLAFEIV
ncbi:MAG: threonine synthase, partial [Methanobacteriota archaeon]